MIIFVQKYSLCFVVWKSFFFLLARQLKPIWQKFFYDTLARLSRNCTSILKFLPLLNLLFLFCFLKTKTV